MFSVDPTALLQLMLYYDELELKNPLGTVGSKTGKHNLGIDTVMEPIMNALACTERVYIFHFDVHQSHLCASLCDDFHVIRKVTPTNNQTV